MIADVEHYFADGCGRCARFATPDCSARLWSRGLAALRGICLGAGLEERVRWGHPCYAHRGRNVALLNAFRGDHRITFMGAAPLLDPRGLLERSGPNARHADTIRFLDAARVEAMAPAIATFLAQAMRLAEAGDRPPREAAAFELPDELVEALDADDALAEAFRDLTPGRQRSYAIALSSAKAPETRRRRVAALHGRILAGKGATER